MVKVTVNDVVVYPGTISGGCNGLFETLTAIASVGAQGEGFAFALDGIHDTPRFVDTTTLSRSRAFDVSSI
ncbi:hypothetical protein [uncultured Jannaschia sp.]|uniref:hypothetical protein n=1 Tax=uncultured Jannaschia sp. TaxID=293347 RepID=UPI0026163CB6|nr:hypothetical protein [uncultured Jannaschia sp.]